MQKIKFLAAALIAALCLGASAAHAQSDVSQSPGPGWVRAFANADSVYWAHRPSRVRNGPIVGMWVIGNFMRPKPGITGSYVSERRFIEYHCANRRSRSVEITYHSDFSARGNEIISSFGRFRPDEDWSVVPPDSFNEITMNIACGR